MNTFLHFISAKYQYEGQKSTGMAGFIGLALAFFVLFKWESIFYPLLDKIGLVSLATNLGLVNENPLFTAANIFGTIFFIFLFFAVVSFLSFIIGTVFFLLGNSKFGGIVMGTAFVILFFPLLLPFIIALIFTGNVQNPVKAVKKEFLEKDPLKLVNYNYFVKKKKYKGQYLYFSLYKNLVDTVNRKEDIYKQDLWELGDEEPGRNALTQYLGIVLPSIRDSRIVALGYSKKLDQFYALFPQPLFQRYSQMADYDGRPYNGIRHLRACVSRITDPDPAMFAVGMEVQMYWDYKEKRFRIRLKEGAFIKLYNIGDMDEFFEFQHERDSVPLMEEVTKRDDYYTFIHEAHVIFYTLPYLFKASDYHPNRISEYDVDYHLRPGCHEYKDLYLPDVRKCISEGYAFNEAWAVNYVHIYGMSEFDEETVY